MSPPSPKSACSSDQISRFALAGFSMGGNLVLKLAGEWGKEGPPQFRAVAAVCPAMDLAASADALHLAAIVCTNIISCGNCAAG